MDNRPPDLSSSCRCRLCEPGAGPAKYDSSEQKLLADVQRHGWGVFGIKAEVGSPGWAFTVGLWHRFRSPEIAMFGLQVEDMQRWLNIAGDQVKSGSRPQPEELREGIIEGFPVTWRPVHPTWYPDLFGWALWFYRNPPLPIVQLIWPDRHGLFPWQDGSGERCRRDQPSLWIPMSEHPIGSWRLGSDGRKWPFPVDRDARAFTTKRIVHEGSPILEVHHGSDGNWQFVDVGPLGREDILLVHLGHIAENHPEVLELADLAPGWHAWRSDEKSAWQRGPFTAEQD